MPQFRLNHSWLVALLTAFLAMQLNVVSAAHIHLAEHHDHDNSHHQHSIEVHAHNQITHHADAIDASHQSSNSNSVSLDYECNIPHGKYYQKSSLAVIATSFPLLLKVISNSSNPIDVSSSKASYLYRTTINPRAPPQFS